jgi:beta-glucosidase
MDSSYLDVEVSPQFPFVFGLTYTTFHFDDLCVSPNRAVLGTEIIVSVRVTNTGNCAGTAVAQLYIRDQVASLTRPMRELKGFSRVMLLAAESKTVTFALDSTLLQFCGREGRMVTEPGVFQVYVGEDCRAELTATFELENP